MVSNLYNILKGNWKESRHFFLHKEIKRKKFTQNHYNLIYISSLCLISSFKYLILIYILSVCFEALHLADKQSNPRVKGENHLHVPFETTEMPTSITYMLATQKNKNKSHVGHLSAKCQSHVTHNVL